MDIFQRISEIALNLAPDYPDIKNRCAMEQLWAVEQGFIGANQANSDMHKTMDALRQRLGMSVGELVDLHREINGLSNHRSDYGGVHLHHVPESVSGAK